MAQPDSAIASGASARSLQDGKAVPVIAVKETAPNLTSIAGDLPRNCSAYALSEDHVNPDLLFLGTEFGAYFTLDGGAT